MDKQLTRRAAIGAIGLAGATAALPIAAATVAQGQSVDRSAWDRAFRVWEKAKAEEDAFNPVCDQLYEQYRKAVDAVPHITLRPDPYSGRRKPVTTADSGFVAEARHLVEQVKAGKLHLETERYPSLGEHWQLAQEVAAAADERDAKIAAIRARFGMDEAEEKWEALGQASYEAEWALMDIPAPDLPALQWKLEKLLRTDPEDSVSCWSAEAIATTMADVRRLLSGEG